MMRCWMVEPCPWTCSRLAPTSGLHSRKQTNRHTRFLDQSPPIVNCSAADWRLVGQFPITRKSETQVLARTSQIWWRLPDIYTALCKVSTQVRGESGGERQR